MDLKAPTANRMNGVSGRKFKKAAEGAQTCRYCRLLDPEDTCTPHSFVKYQPPKVVQNRKAGKFGVGNKQHIAAKGCPRYDEGKSYFDSQPERVKKKRKCTYYLPYSMHGEIKAECCPAAFRSVFAESPAGRVSMSQI